MGLRETAAADFVAILQDPSGFGWPIRVTNPSGLSLEMIGYSTDVAQTIDPETGQAVSGRTASVTLAIATLLANAMGIPCAVAEKDRHPWRVLFHDVHGKPHTFKVQEALPDRAIGAVVCLLEAHKPNFPESPWPPGS